MKEPEAPGDLPDIQIELGRMWAAGGLFDRVARRLRGIAGGALYSRWERQTLAGATLWWVSPIMCELLEQVYPTIPDDLILDASTWTADRGLVVFASDMPGIDAATGERCTLRAVAWGPSHMLFPNRVGSLPCVSFSSYGWAETLGQLVMLGRSDWPLAEPLGIVHAYTESLPELGEQPGFVASVIDDRRLMAALWLTAAQPHLIEVVEQDAPWVARKRAQRAGFPDRPVKVITFRRAVAIREGLTAESGRKMTKRFAVGWYWRNQRCGPGLANTKLILVAPHWRGPVDGEVDVRPVVKALRR